MLPSVLPRLATDSAVRVFPGVWKPLFLRLPSRDGAPSLPLLSLFLFFYIFSYLFLKTMSCFSGCPKSSAGIQKLFCGIYSVLKCSFDEFVWEKVVSLSYSSAILGLPLIRFLQYVFGCRIFYRLWSFILIIIQWFWCPDKRKWAQVLLLHNLVLSYVVSLLLL